MAGAPYEAGGINVTIEATRAAPDVELRSAAAARLDEAHRAGITTIEVKTGYGATVFDEARPARLGQELTTETTFLGAHVVPPGWDADHYVELVCGEMLSACAPHVRWIDAFCERGAFDADQCRKVLETGRTAGLGLRLHANQLGHGPGVQLAVELGCASADHCTYLSDPTSTRWLPATRWRRSSRPRTSRPASRTPTPAVSSTPGPPWRWRRTATPGRATRPRCRSSSPSPCATFT